MSPDTKRCPNPKVEALFVTLIILAGCSQARAKPHRVVILGDSITQLAAPEIRATVPEATIEAVYGKTARKMVGAVRTTHASVLIIEGGTDDAIEHEADWQTAQDALIRLSSKTCAWFVTVAEVPATGPIAPQWNARLYASHVRLIDWNAALQADRSLGEITEVHPSPAGQRWFAEQYRRAVDAC